MSKVRFNVTISLDGYMAGPGQTEETPLGAGGEDLHQWLIELSAWREAHGEGGGRVNASTPVAEDLGSGYGAVIMGRNMFGPIRAEWGDRPWHGWWGDNPPFHVPVFVLTHYEHASLPMEGGTTFHFVTGGAGQALEQAKAAAGGADVLLAGGASVLRQYLAASAVDEFWLSVAPLLLGGGERPLDGLPAGTRLEVLDVINAPQATHLKYAVRRGAAR